MREIETYNVPINYELYFSILFSYYISTYYYKGKDESKQLVNYIMELVSTNPYVKKEFEKHKDFYQQNFNFSII